MAVHVFEREQLVPAPLDAVVDFFSNAYNLEQITPPELRFRILTPAPIEMRAGARIRYRLRLLGVPFSWETEIERWDPPRGFVDAQRRGPYREWVHTHAFEAVPGGTRTRDHVRYRLPLAPLGDLALPLVRRELERIFDFRARAVETRFGVPSGD